MPNRTIYVKEADLEVWKRAQGELGESISSAIADFLRERVAVIDRSRIAAPAEKIRLEFGLGVVKTFWGEWLFGEETGGFVAEAEEDSRWDPRTEWSVARTPKGNFVVLEHNADWGEPQMRIYASFLELRDAKDETGHPRIPPNVVAGVADKVGVPYEIELDI
jgi:hypothetical protein